MATRQTLADHEVADLQSRAWLDTRHVKHQIDLRGDYGRGERSQTATSDLSVRSRMLTCAVIGCERWLARAG